MGDDRTEILLVNGEREMCESLRAQLPSGGYTLSTAHRCEEGLARAMSPGVGLVVSELSTSDTAGLDLLRQLHPMRPALPVIVVANRLTMEHAVEAAKLGAYEYVSKPFKMSELVQLIIKATSSSEGLFTVDCGQPNALADRMIGSSRAMEQIFKQIGTAANSSANALIRGATGTGKELIAKAIHKFGSRSKQPFVAVNCNAIPEALFESELFGHETGAFTGAAGRHTGFFERAQFGTLFLDEIGDLMPASQAKLLRVLEERSIHPLGGRHAVNLDVQVVAATHRDLEYLIQTGDFREDLLHRLGGLIINLPELCEHAEDIWPLTRHFIIKHRQGSSAAPTLIHRDAVAFLERQPWPGNVRQLENTVRRAVLLTRGQPITLPHIQEAFGRPRSSSSARVRSVFEPPTDLFEKAEAGEITNLYSRFMEQAEETLFKKALAKARGNKSKIARWLGLTRKTVRSKLLQFRTLTPGDPNPPQTGPRM
jgi:DNA-binding NtrC family response regulator